MTLPSARCRVCDALHGLTHDAVQRILPHDRAGTRDRCAGSMRPPTGFLDPEDPDACDACGARLRPGAYSGGCEDCDALLCGPCARRHGSRRCAAPVTGADRNRTENGWGDRFTAPPAVRTDDGAARSREA